MSYKSFTNKFIENINKNNYSYAINYAFNNMNKIVDAFNDNNNKINFSKQYFKNSKLTNDINGIRMSILILINEHKDDELKEKDEVKQKKYRTNITYQITTADNKIKIKLFCLYLLIYSFEAKVRHSRLKTLNSKPHVGIDFEFFKGDIALMQLNFETYSDINSKTISYIWIVNPNDFDDIIMQLVIDKLMINRYIYKILHGPDSQDIPYVYDKMLNNNKNHILLFTRKLIDTRFLCEYFRLSIGLDKKCTIYSALKYFGTITENKYNGLNQIHDLMGPVQDIEWNINKLDIYHFKYAYYDVLFLKHYLFDIYKKVAVETPNLVYSYRYVNSIIRFVFLDRRDVISVVKDAKNDIDPINNYLIKYKEKNYSMINIFNDVLDNFKVCKNEYCLNYIDYNFLLSVGFLKNSLIILFKKMAYYAISKTYIVYTNKKEQWVGKLNIKDTFDRLRANRFKNMIDLLDKFKREVYKRIQTKFPKNYY